MIYRLTIVFSFFIIAGLLLWFLYFMGMTGLLKAIHVLLTFYLVGIYLFSSRYPQLIHIIRLEAEREKYLNSQVKNIDAAEIIRKLDFLVHKEKLFLREDISLKDVAARLDITAHQLSEILNTRLEKNFFSFINELRIDEAKKLLRDKPDEPVLAVAFRTGFNSSSSFYTAFKKYAGMSPAAWRKKSE